MNNHIKHWIVALFKYKFDLRNHYLKNLIVTSDVNLNAPTYYSPIGLSLIMSLIADAFLTYLWITRYKSMLNQFQTDKGPLIVIGIGTVAMIYLTFRLFQAAIVLWKYTKIVGENLPTSIDL